jgi:1-phosphofructokinase
VNVAQAIKRFGLPVCALGLVAGRNGRFILEALSAAGIPADFITVPGETRVNLKIHDPVKGTETELNEPGFSVPPERLAEMRRKIEAYAPRCEVMVFSGSLPLDAPPETFGDFITIAKNCGAKCILDTAGAALRHGLAAGPCLIKPNRAEVEGLLQKPLRTSHELAEAARTLIAMGTQQVVISLGAEGALGATQDEVLIARPPAVKVQSSIGAGDTMVAVLAFALVEGMPFRQAFRLAVAASAATVAMEGTKVADFAAAQDLVPQVKVEDAVAV